MHRPIKRHQLAMTLEMMEQLELSQLLLTQSGSVCLNHTNLMPLIGPLFHPQAGMAGSAHPLLLNGTSQFFWLFR
jgi:hypothetical protein